MSAAADPLKILIVDDYDLFAAALYGALTPYEDLSVVGRAADGVEAVAAATELRPDVVLMDVDMPRLDGLRATRIVRDKLPETAVVVVSGSHDAETAARARSAGASAFVFKSCPVEDLVAAVREAKRGVAARAA
jgi:DNA-binding NarL/FixJ family response regulator